MLTGGQKNILRPNEKNRYFTDKQKHTHKEKRYVQLEAQRENVFWD